MKLDKNFMTTKEWNDTCYSLEDGQVEFCWKPKDSYYVCVDYKTIMKLAEIILKNEQGRKG